MTSIENADGRMLDFTYDNPHRLTAEKWMSGNTVVATMSYSYNLDNDLTSASDPNSAYAFGYNGDGDRRRRTSGGAKGALWPRFR